MNIDLKVVSKPSDDLVASIKMATLSDTEIQSLIEILLNKQGRGNVPVQWTKVSSQKIHNFNYTSVFISITAPIFDRVPWTGINI